MGALQSRDTNALTNIFSSSEHLRYIGSDVDEVWAGDLFRAGYGDHVGEIPPFTLNQTHIEAHECGPAGWVTWLGEINFDGMPAGAPYRFSWVLVLEDGAWKVTHMHVSCPKSNVEVMGVEHTAFDRLIEAAKDGYDRIDDEGTATVMFTDIVNSTSIAGTVGDRAWASIIRDHLETSSKVITDNGGRVVKTLGDGTMSTFASARGAMSAAKTLQTRVGATDGEPKLQLRVGIHTGDVVSSDGDFFGTVVNKAARIASSANPGQILVSDATRAMVGDNGEFELESPISVALRGIEGNHSISTLKWA